MNRILIASLAALSFASVASAQQAPSSQAGSTRVGAQSQTPAQTFNGPAVDYTTTGSIKADDAGKAERVPALGGYDPTVSQDDLHR